MVLFSFSKFQDRLVLNFMDNLVNSMQWQIENELSSYVENATKVISECNPSDYSTELIIESGHKDRKVISLKKIWDSMGVILQGRFRGFIFVVLLVYDKADFMKFLRESIYKIEITLVIALLVSLILASVLSLRESAFLVAFSTAAKRLSEGDFEIRIDPDKVRGAYKELANSFNRMAVELDDYIRKTC